MVRPTCGCDAGVETLILTDRSVLPSPVAVVPTITYKQEGPDRREQGDA